VSGRHHVADLDHSLRATACRGDDGPRSVDQAQPRRVLGADPEAAVRVLLAPGGVAEDVVGGERPSLADGQDDRESVSGVDHRSGNDRQELVEHLGQLERDPPVGVDDPGEVIAVLVAGEHDSGRRVQDRLEQLVTVCVTARRTASG
jgi:hypothetical protein